MTAYFIEDGNLTAFLGGINRGPLIGAVEGPNGPQFERDAEPASMALRVPRPAESLKSVLFPARERVAVYPDAEASAEPDVDPNMPQVIVGGRGCDLRAIELLDKIFIQDDFVDPFYTARKECSLLVSVDCTVLADTCFCNLVGGVPYAESGFDVNLSPIEGGCVVEIGSEKGKELVLEKAHLFVEATTEQLRQRDDSRAAVAADLEQKNAEYHSDKSLEEIVHATIESDKWNALSINCVECGGCSFICPTCHCFLLTDQPSVDQPGKFERMKVWDSCILASFSRMAGVGGMKGSPRPELRSRFQNRLLHKYVWFFENFERLGCVGCGRCVDACLGGSDMRKVLAELGSSNGGEG